MNSDAHGIAMLWSFFCFIPILVIVMVPVLIYFLARGGGKMMASKDRELQRRFEQGRCLNCGYDLRASPNGRCPECGKF